MIRFLEHSTIDKSKWDRCIESSPNRLIYAASWYLDIVSPGWSALVEHDYTSVFPLTRRKKFGFHYLYQPPFTQQLGLFGKEPSGNTEQLLQFLVTIPSMFKLVEINLNSQNDLHAYVENFAVFPKRTYVLSLDNTFENIRKHYRDDLHRNIRKAEKNNLHIENDLSTAEIIGLFKSNKGRNLKTLSEKDYENYVTLIAKATEKDRVQQRTIRNSDGKLIAGAIFLRSYGEYVFHFSATGPEARENGAMPFLIDAFIREHAGEKMKLDFEGSMDPNLARFYKGFGSKEVVYLQIRRNNLPALIRRFKS